MEVGGRGAEEGNPIFYMEMCKWHAACLSLVCAFLGWRERVERDVRAKKGT